MFERGWEVGTVDFLYLVQRLSLVEDHAVVEETVENIGQGSTKNDLFL